MWQTCTRSCLSQMEALRRDSLFGTMTLEKDFYKKYVAFVDVWEIPCGEYGEEEVCQEYQGARKLQGRVGNVQVPTYIKKLLFAEKNKILI